MTEADFDVLPGGSIVREGLRDLAAGRETVAALLLAIGAPRLRRLGLDVDPIDSAEMRLYQLLAQEFGDAAHSRYNALVRTLVSFERAAECAQR